MKKTTRIAPPARLRRRASRWIAVGMAVLLGGSPGSAIRGADGPALTEQELKALVLFNFAKFVEWPTAAFEQPDSPIVIGILGDDPFGAALDKVVAGQTVNNRPLTVRRAKEVSALRNCHILFISGTEKRRFAEVLETVRQMSILTVADTERFAEMGGMINLFMDHKRVRFEINVDAAQKAGLKISAQLLRLGKIVRDKRD